MRVYATHHLLFIKLGRLIAPNLPLTYFSSSSVPLFAYLQYFRSYPPKTEYEKETIEIFCFFGFVFCYNNGNCLLNNDLLCCFVWTQEGIESSLRSEEIASGGSDFQKFSPRAGPSGGSTSPCTPWLSLRRRRGSFLLLVSFREIIYAYWRRQYA